MNSDVGFVFLSFFLYKISIEARAWHSAWIPVHLSYHISNIHITSYKEVDQAAHKIVDQSKEFHMTHNLSSKSLVGGIRTHDPARNKIRLCHSSWKWVYICGTFKFKFLTIFHPASNKLYRLYNSITWDLEIPFFLGAWGRAGPWIPVPVFAGYGTINQTPMSCR